MKTNVDLFGKLFSATRLVAALLLSVGCLVAPAARAQLSSGDIPDTKFVSTDFGSSEQVQKDLLNLLRTSSAGDYMHAIEGFEVAFSDLLIDVLKDQLVELLADVMPTGSLGAKVMKKYQDKKDKSLAEEIDRIKAIAKKALNNELKIRFQKLKVDMARMDSKWKPHPDVTGGIVEKRAISTAKSMWGEHVSNVEEYYDDAHTNDLLKYRDLSVGKSQADNVPENGWVSSIATGLLMQESEGYVKLANTISDNEFKLGDESTDDSQLMSLSVYDRMQIKRRALDLARRNVNAVRAVTRLTNHTVQAKLRAEQRGITNQGIGGKARYKDAGN